MTDMLTMILITSIFLGGLGLVAFLWALKSGQFDDEDKTSHMVFFDGEEELNAARDREKKEKKTDERE